MPSITLKDVPEERAERQITAWRALAGSWESNEAFEDDVAALYAARTPGRDVSL